jgi:diguanylate cyclase (GGDEF)-like protein
MKCGVMKMTENSGRNPKILIVDDIPVNVELQKTYLLSAGYSVIVAGDGEKAMELVAEEKPDLVLLDVMMPKLNGFEVCEKIKSNPATRFIPVVLVTALQEVEDKVRGIEAGADDFISKPFNKMELMARVKSLLRIKLLHDQLEEKIDLLNEARDQLEKLASTDGLTGLYNHRYFKEQLRHEVDRATRHNSPLSLLMMDIDFFKYYNDHQGHPAGDEVLRQIAQLILKNIRKIDVAARYGGEEFAVILPETDSESAVVVAEKIRSFVQQTGFVKEENQPNGCLTLSIGIANFPEDTREGRDLVNIADRRLYKAKQAGRNTLVYD